MTLDRCVVDASVIGAAMFNEVSSDRARRFLSSGSLLLAPELLRAEIASLLAKKVWREETSLEVGRRMMGAIDDVVDEFVSTTPLAARAFELAAKHRFSAYDALYVALAEARSLSLITLDAKLIQRARSADLDVALAEPSA